MECTSDVLFKHCVRIEHAFGMVYNALKDDSESVNVQDKNTMFKVLLNTWLKEEIDVFKIEFNDFTKDDFFTKNKIKSTNNFGVLYNTFSRLLFNQGYCVAANLSVDIIEFYFVSYLTDSKANACENITIFLEFISLYEAILEQTNQTN